MRMLRHPLLCLSGKIRRFLFSKIQNLLFPCFFRHADPISLSIFLKCHLIDHGFPKMAFQNVKITQVFSSAPLNHVIQILCRRIIRSSGHIPLAIQIRAVQIGGDSLKTGPNPFSFPCSLPLRHENEKMVSFPKTGPYVPFPACLPTLPLDASPSPPAMFHRRR